MFSRWAFILIGNDSVGKTSFQRNLVFELSGIWNDRLHCNVVRKITHPRMSGGVKDISVMSRSFQEKQSDYGSVASFFKSYFRDASICILSSHSTQQGESDVSHMISELRRRAYNVGGLFFSNGFNQYAENISLQNWDERLWIDNPILEDTDEIQIQITQIAKNFSEMLIERSRFW